MKQVIQNYRTGELELAEVPYPACKSNGVIVKNVSSAISIGTEKLMLSTAKKSLLKKALDRPDLVKKVINMAKTEGISEAYRQAKNRLDDPIPLGYSCAGIIEEIGSGVLGYQKGDKVACFGSNYATHAEYNWIPKNLIVRIPEELSFEEASFVGIGAISLHAIRKGGITLGENVAVIGLGLLGLIAIQILRSLNCKVLGVDINNDRLELAKKFGCNFVANANDRASVVQSSKDLSEGYGVDKVLVYASNGDKNSVSMYAEMARDRGKIIIPGVIPMEVPRKDFFEKELELVVPRSAGPGIFDENYELKGVDYPIGDVRWSEQRNMKAFLDLVASNKVSVKDLITHRFNFTEAEKAYDLIIENKEPVLGSIFKYNDENTNNHYKKKTFNLSERTNNLSERTKGKKDQVVLGLIGAGLFAKTTLLPILKKMDNVRLKWLATTTGLTANHNGKKFGFENITTDYKEILSDDEVDAVMVLTRHNTHAKFVSEVLDSHKNVFVEKPLCINEKQLNSLDLAHSNNPDNFIMVGFNRRFSPHSIFIKENFKNAKGPFVVTCRVNAGYAEKDSWVLDPESGGGRIVGEACHFIDLISFLTNELPVSIYVETIDESNGFYKSDNLVISIKLSNGSLGSIVYYANGHKRYPREIIEISGNGMVGIINNFVKSKVFKGSHIKNKKTLGVDRGHRNELREFVNAIQLNYSPFKYEELFQTTLASILAEGLPTTKKSIMLNEVK